MKTINWETSTEDRILIDKIVARAIELAGKHKIKYDCLTCEMDIIATHLNCMKLDLERLLSFPDFDFIHDVFGVRRHINRDTAQLEDCFVPRCAR